MREIEDEKKHRRDRRDARYLGKLDSMHQFMPYLLPNRADNEAVMNEVLDLSAVEQYLEEKNAGNPAFKYTLFHVMCAAIAKVFALRPKLNRYIMGYRYFERKEISLSFVVKKSFSDEGEEGLAIVTLDPAGGSSPLEQIYNKVYGIVTELRIKNKNDGATDVMDLFVKLPRPALKLLAKALFFLDYHGIMPKELAADDPYHCSAFITNLGSIKMKASYHHLANWGTNSFFVVVGEKQIRPFFSPDGSYDMRPCLELGLTIDERIADGLYYAKSIKILRRLIADPWLLDRPLAEPLPEEETVPVRAAAGQFAIR